MMHGKNLTIYMERKATFSSVDVTGQLSIDSRSFLSSGNIVSSGSTSASHADFVNCTLIGSIVIKAHLIL